MPGDPVSEDGQLATAMNVAKDNEIDCSIIEQPVSLFAFDDIKDKDGNTLGVQAVLFIHANNNWKHYITHGYGKLQWVDAESLVGEEICEIAYPTSFVINVSAIGNTLIYNDKNGIHYLLWRDNHYIDLGQRPPMTEITFGLNSHAVSNPRNIGSSVPIQVGPIWVDSDKLSFPVTNTSPGYMDPTKDNPSDNIDFSNNNYLTGVNGSEEARDEVREALTSEIMAAINKLIADAAEDNQFMMPFFVRYAYEMYDGSMVCHSEPVYMIPSGKGVFFGIDGTRFYCNEVDNGKEQKHIQFSGRAYGMASTLVMDWQVPDKNELSKWEDLVKSVGIYVTPAIYPHKQGGFVQGWMKMDDAKWEEFVSEGKLLTDTNTNYREIPFKNKPSLTGWFGNLGYRPYGTESYPYYIARLDYLTSREYLEETAKAAQFYRIGEIKFKDLVKAGKSGVGVNVIDNEKDKKMVSTLTSGRQMKDDYHTNDTLSANVFDVYNHRFNIADVTRALHNPMAVNLSWPKINGTNSHKWQLKVFVKDKGEVFCTGVSALGANNKEMPKWIFYPDRNAERAELTFFQYGGSTQKIYSLELREHELLEGAYWLKGLCDVEELTSSTSNVYPNTIHEPGYIYTSDVENPFIFPASGVNQIGDGTVKAMAQAVQALSEGQFGVHPMYAFTDQGVWALTPSPEGAWRSVQPVTRDVIAEGTMPLSIDTSVIFVSGRGVMLLSGSTTRVIDTAIQGEWKDSFASLANVVKAWDNDSPIPGLVTLSQGFYRIGSNTRMVYDYRHQRVYFCCGEFSWVLNLKTWAWTQSQTKVSTPLNSYPGCEFVTDRQVYSLDRDGRYPMAVMLTRPIKTAGEMLAKVRALVVRGNVPSGTPGVVAAALFGSRDWHNNALVATSTRPRITRIGGSGCRTHSLLVMMRDQELYKTLLERAVIDIQEVQYDKCR